MKSTTLDPRTRTLLKVEITSNADAHNAFRDVLGRDAAPRYAFIMSDAEKAVAEELDV